MSGVRKHVQAY